MENFEVITTTKSELGYCLNSKIQIGDIILFATNTKFGSIIKRATKGPFSHVGLVFNHGKYIEALTKCVQATSTSQITIKYKENIKVLRPNILQEKDIALTYQESICLVSNPLRNSKYNFVDAMKCISENTKLSCNDRFFCSQLVAVIYNRVGIQLFIDKEEHRITPNDYITLIDKNLVDITEDVVSPIPKWNILLQTKLDYIDINKKTEYLESYLISQFIKSVKIKLDKLDIVLVSEVGIFELLSILEDIDNLELKVKIDDYFVKKFESLKILSKTRANFNKIENYNYYKLKEDLEKLSLRDIQDYFMNLRTQIKNLKFKIAEFDAYLNLFNHIEKKSFEEFGYKLKFIDILRAYYDIYI